jgi:hypothetical protein
MESVDVLISFRRGMVWSSSASMATGVKYRDGAVVTSVPVRPSSPSSGRRMSRTVFSFSR